jgi:hypothetical protein
MKFLQKIRQADSYRDVIHIGNKLQEKEISKLGENGCILSNEEYDECKDFARKVADTQNENNFYGLEIRPIERIINDTITGKVGEFVVKKMMKKLANIDIELDMEIYEKGIGDSGDIEIKGKTIAVKASKMHSKWLLVESMKIDNMKEYFDYYILIGVSGKMGKILGIASKERFIKKAVKIEEGSFIPKTDTRLAVSNYALSVDDMSNDLLKLANGIIGIRRYPVTRRYPVRSLSEVYK